MRRTTPRVLQAINAWPQVPFRWGTSDCCHFVAFVVYELTGRDHLEGLDWNDEASADALIATHGSLSGTVSAVLGDPVPKCELIPGDPVLWKWQGVEGLAVYLGTSNAAAITKSGRLLQIPLRRCVWGWRV